MHAHMHFSLNYLVHKYMIYFKCETLDLSLIHLGRVWFKNEFSVHPKSTSYKRSFKTLYSV